MQLGFLDVVVGVVAIAQTPIDLIIAYRIEPIIIIIIIITTTATTTTTIIIIIIAISITTPNPLGGRGCLLGTLIGSN